MLALENIKKPADFDLNQTQLQIVSSIPKFNFSAKTTTVEVLFVQVSLAMQDATTVGYNV